MGCCGQGRAAIRSTSSFDAPQKPASTAPDRGVVRVLVRYLAHAPVSVRGVHTGRMYSFDGEQAELHVHADDAAALLKSRFFVRAD
jgi:hypothetical protein